MTPPSADSATDGRAAAAPVPSIKELRERTQIVKTESDRRWSYLVFRKVSIYITWVLVHTRITANQVTVISLLAAAGGLVFLGAGPRWAFGVGLGLLLAYHLLDRVDGEVARYRGVTSIHGIYLDNVGHHITTAGILIAAGYSLRNEVESPTELLLLVAIAGLASSLARVAKHAAFQLHSQYVYEDPSLAADLPETDGPLTRSAIRKSRSTGDDGGTAVHMTLLGFVAGQVLAWTQFPATVALLLGAWIIDGLRGGTSVISWMLVIVCAFQIAAYVAAEAANLAQNLASEARRLWERDRD